MRSIEMAVVVSEEAGKKERFKNRWISSHIVSKSIEIDENGHDIEYRFKDQKQFCVWSSSVPCG